MIGGSDGTEQVGDAGYLEHTADSGSSVPVSKQRTTGLTGVPPRPTRAARPVNR